MKREKQHTKNQAYSKVIAWWWNLPWNKIVVVLIENECVEARSNKILYWSRFSIIDIYVWYELETSQWPVLEIEQEHSLFEQMKLWTSIHLIHKEQKSNKE